MISLKVELKLDLSDNESSKALKSAMRDYTLLMFKIKKIRLDGQKVTEALNQQYAVLIDEVKDLLLNAIKDNPTALTNLGWNTENFVTTEEEACILAPPG